jgi:hypothetical protein
MDAAGKMSDEMMSDAEKAAADAKMKADEAMKDKSSG